jgi:uncharacterized membrane protein (DUF4010 family)
MALWPALVAPFVIGAVFAWIGMLRPGRDPSTTDTDKNPLQIVAALQMAVMFQIVLFGVAYAHQRFGSQGLTGSAALLGLTDVDALTVSMARVTNTGVTPADAAAFAVTLGIFVNTLVKLGIAIAFGRGRFRWMAAIGLAMIAAALGAALLL